MKQLHSSCSATSVQYRRKHVQGPCQGVKAFLRAASCKCKCKCLQNAMEVLTASWTCVAFASVPISKLLAHLLQSMYSVTRGPRTTECMCFQLPQVVLSADRLCAAWADSAAWQLTRCMQQVAGICSHEGPEDDHACTETSTTSKQ